MSDIFEDADDFLAHYGVLGMRWGVRKSRNAPNPDYNSNQRKRDRQVYGRRGERRINRALNRGDSISVARGDEKTRRDRVMGRNKYVRQVGKVAGVVGGVALANLAVSGLKKAAHSRPVINFMNKYVGQSAQYATVSALSLLDSPQGRIALSTGAAVVGNLLAGDIAVGINMRSHGYNPNRK